MRRPLLVALLLVTSPVAADVPAPNDEYCDLELQQRDGSTCEACSAHVNQLQAGEDPCAELRERDGWYHRCSRGATVSTSIFCDREADFVEVGQEYEDGAPAASGLCGCRAAGSSAPVPWSGLLLLGAALWLRRRSRQLQ